MPSFEYPYLAVVLSAVVAVGLGILWYHPKCQGTKWMEARGAASPEGNPSAFHIGSSFMLWLLAACFVYTDRCNILGLSLQKVIAPSTTA